MRWYKDLSHLFQTLNDYRSLCKSINLTPRATAERWSALAVVISLLCITAAIAACCVSKTVLHIFLFAIACHPILFIPTFNIDRIYADAYVQQSGADGSYYPDVNNALRKRLNYGCLLLNYIGHGSYNYIGTERYMEFNDIDQYTPES